jgi:hypothetical protein
MEVLRAVATSVLVCFAQNPYVLKMNNPRLFQEIDDSFVVRTGRGFDEPEYDYEDYEEEGEDGEQEELLASTATEIEEKLFRALFWQLLFGHSVSCSVLPDSLQGQMC